MRRAIGKEVQEGVMWIGKKRLKQRLHESYERGYNQAFQMDSRLAVYALKQILEYKRFLEGKPGSVLEAQIEEILRRKGL